MNGIIITPMMMPHDSAFWYCASTPKSAKNFTIAGAMVRAAKKPYTTVGIPAKISKKGFTCDLSLGVAYSDIKIADISPTGTAKIIAIMVM